ncbi:MAG: 2'-5' RNA ligase family protein [Clostridia bacterium]|nr:2'-5' RNA ligase family protein [Clostridia bacterium]
MFIWTAIEANQQLNDLRQHITEIPYSPNPCLTLPLHVSLKVSFEVEDKIANDVIQAIAEYLSSQTPFVMKTQAIECYTKVTWISIQPSTMLKSLHDGLDDLMELRFGIQPHEFDRAFRYHASLFYADDGKHVQEAYQLLKDIAVPEQVLADTFVIGVSESGAAGTYHVIKTISVK